MTYNMKYELMSEEQIKKCADLKLLRYTQCENELSLYYNPKTGHIVAKWVDDLITRGSRAVQLEFWENLGNRFDIKSWGIVERNEPRVFCNKEISVEITDGIKWYNISQEHDIRQWLVDQGMTAVIPVLTPMANKTELHSNENMLEENDATNFRSRLGSLQYYAKETRDDIAAAVNMIAQKCKAPTVGAAKAVRRVMAYLNGTAARKLTVPRVNGTQWDFYVDSDHAGDRKYGDTLSRTGVKLLCNGMQFHWRSNKQPSTAMSSTAAEIVAMSECMKDVNLRMWIAEEVGQQIDWPVKIYVDNKAGVHFQNQMSPDTKLKGIFDMRMGWLKELHDKKKFVAVKVATEKNLADDLTKPLDSKTRQRLDMEVEVIKKQILDSFRGHVSSE